MSALVKEGIAIVQQAVAADSAGDAPRAVGLYTAALAKLDAALATPGLKPGEQAFSGAVRGLGPALTHTRGAASRHAAALAQTTRTKRAEYAARRDALAAKQPAEAAPAPAGRRAAMAALNAAMDADRARDWPRALELYQTHAAVKNGIGLLLALRGSSDDAAERMWVGDEAARHLARAETLKAALAERRRQTSTAGPALLSRADDAFAEQRWSVALSLYEQALAALRAEPDHDPADLVRANTQIELLVKREEEGEFRSPVALGLEPGEVYVDPVPKATKLHKMKKLTLRAKTSVERKFQDDPW